MAALWAPRLRVLGGDLLHEPEPALERIIGTPAVTAPARVLAVPLALTARNTIRKIQPQAAGGHLLSVKAGWLLERSDSVVQVVPVPQAVPLSQRLSPSWRSWSTALPWADDWSVMARFATLPELPFDEAFVNSGLLYWILRDTRKPGRTGPETWVLHASVEWSEPNLGRDTDTIAVSLLQDFGRLGGPASQASTVHRWRYASVMEPVLDKAYSSHVGMSVSLCGDWLNGGKVEGAWLSGRELAQRALE